VARKASAGLLLWRRTEAGPEFFLVHPGGPFWKNKDAAAWSIPKGEVDAGEESLAAARREFEEETGQLVAGDFRPLAAVRQPGGKLVHAWLVEAEVDAGAVRSNSFTMEWPPRSGRQASFPEIDKAAWFHLAEALDKVHKGQRPLLLEAAALLGSAPLPPLD
jgi:predicted NUDIX family NTP pyrophosphohydrolase